MVSARNRTPLASAQPGLDQNLLESYLFAQKRKEKDQLSLLFHLLKVLSSPSIPASRPSVRSNSSRDIPRPSPPQQDSSPFARRLASLAAGMREGRLSRCSAY
ncbi:hypothetical protein HDV57DRAFT_405465 [Trichoderma longibrachiatum]